MSKSCGQNRVARINVLAYRRHVKRIWCLQIHEQKCARSLKLQRANMLSCREAAVQGSTTELDHGEMSSMRRYVKRDVAFLQASDAFYTLLQMN